MQKRQNYYGSNTDANLIYSMIVIFAKKNHTQLTAVTLPSARFAALNPPASSSAFAFLALGSSSLLADKKDYQSKKGIILGIISGVILKT